MLQIIGTVVALLVVAAITIQLLNIMDAVAKLLQAMAAHREAQANSVLSHAGLLHTEGDD